MPCIAGLHLAALFKTKTDGAEVLRQAARQDVGLYGLREFQLGRGGRQGLVLGYGTIEEAAIIQGLSRLAAVLRSQV